MGEEIYDLLFSSKHAGDNIRFSFIIIVFNSMLGNYSNFLPLFLTIDKRGKSTRFIQAKLVKN